MRRYLPHSTSEEPVRCWLFEDGFGFENLKRRDDVTPVPGPRDVLLKMHAASLNFRDLVVLRGQHGKAVQPPLIPLSDGVGIVVAKGTEVQGVDIGDRVCPCFFQNWLGGLPPLDLEAARLGGPLDGVLATHRVFPASRIVHVPDHLSDAEAATLPCAGVTAWSALNASGALRPGESVLILGSGGVALMAVQLAKAMGAQVIVTTSSGTRAQRLGALGADFVIDRTEIPDWAREVRKLTGGGCDRVVELGGAATLGASIKSVRTGGKIILIGNVTGNNAELFLPAVLTRQLTLQAVTVGSRDAFVALNRALAFHDIRPVVGQTFGFDDVTEAFGALQAQNGFGNICVSINAEA